MIANNENNINLFQRMLGCEASERSRVIGEVMSLLKCYSAAGHVVHLDLRENDLTVDDLRSLAQYDGNPIEVDLSSNNLEIKSATHEQVWASVLGNPQLKLEPGWQQPVRSFSS